MAAVGGVKDSLCPRNRIPQAKLREQGEVPVARQELIGGMGDTNCGYPSVM